MSRRLRVDAALALRLDGAPRTAPDAGLVTAGGTLRLGMGVERLGGALAVTALLPVRIDGNDASISLLRVPIDLLFVVAGRWGRVELAGEAGLATAILRARAGTVENRRLVEGEAEHRLEVGARAGGELRVYLTKRFAAVLGLHAAWFPVAYELRAPGLSTTTPALWLGATLGLMRRMR